jgi:hypothetical protein
MIKNKMERLFLFSFISIGSILITSKAMAMLQQEEEEQLRATSHHVIRQAMSRYDTEERRQSYTAGCISATYWQIRPYVQVDPLKTAVTNIVTGRVQTAIQTERQLFQQQLQTWTQQQQAQTAELLEKQRQDHATEILAYQQQQQAQAAASLEKQRLDHAAEILSYQQQQHAQTAASLEKQRLDHVAEMLTYQKQQHAQTAALLELLERERKDHADAILAHKQQTQQEFARLQQEAQEKFGAAVDAMKDSVRRISLGGGDTSGSFLDEHTAGIPASSSDNMPESLVPSSSLPDQLSD